MGGPGLGGGDQPSGTRGSGLAPTGRRLLSGRAVLLLVVTVVALASVAGPARAYWQQRHQLAAQRADVSARTVDVARLQRQVDRWEDPAFVAAQARSRLRLIKPGETSYVLVTSPATASPSVRGRPRATTTPGGGLLPIPTPGVRVTPAPAPTPTPTPSGTR